jgi:hypothetical protein
MDIINLGILKHPLNWLTVAVWLFAIGFAAVSLGLCKPAPQGVPASTVG